jgi:hypothetical protein
MRMDFASPIHFGDEVTAQLYAKRCAEALSKQRCRFAVAPDLAVRTPHDVVLKAGQEVTEEAMRGGARPPLVLIRDLVAKGYILEASGFDTGPEAA